MKNKKLFGGIILSLLCSVVFSQTPSFKVIKSYSIPSSGGWDYIAVNDGKIYVSHGSQVNILNEASGDSIGVIPGTTGVHGIAFCNELHKGYTSNGRLNNVFVFDLASNNVEKVIATGENPDAITYDDFSKKIITCNGRGKSLSIIDPVKNEVISTIELGAKPETAVSDGKGKLFVNLEDKNEIAVIDMNQFKVISKWSILPGESATGLAMDKETNRLFAGCDNKLLIVMDALNGKVVSSLPIGDGCDGVAFDEKEKLIFTSNGEGTLTVIKEENANKFQVVQNVSTKKSARTLTLDPSNQTLFLPAADFETPAAGAPANERRKMIAGSFKVLVVGK